MHVRYLLDLKHFNPRTHEECDKKPATMDADGRNFNPRTHEECDV